MKNKSVSSDSQELLQALSIASKWLGKPVAVDSLSHRVAEDYNSKLGLGDVAKLSKEFLNIETKLVEEQGIDIEKISLPAIAKYKNEYIVLVKIENDIAYYFIASNNKIAESAIIDLKSQLDSKLLILKANTINPKDSDSDFLDFGLRWIFKRFLHYKIELSQILGSAFILQLFVLATPLFTMIIIDKVFSASGRSTLEVLIIALFIVALFDLLVSYSRRHLLSRVSSKVDAIISAQLFKHMISLPLGFFASKQTGDTVARFKEVEFVRNFISSSALTTIIDFPFAIVFIIVMLLFSPTLTLIVVVAICLMFLLYGVLGPYLKDKMKEKQQTQVEGQTFLFETISSMETIKSMSLEPRLERSYNDHITNQLLQNQDSEDISGNLGHWAGFINKGTTALCLLVGAIGVLGGTMTAGQLIAFNMLVGRIMAPAQKIAQMLQQLVQVKLSVQRIGEVLSTEKEPSVFSNFSSMPSLKGDIKFENVSFGYDDNSVIKEINLEMPKGQIVGLVGHSGSGKTTISRLIQRLYLPTSGKVMIDGINLASIDPVWFRRNLGVVMQDNLLLNRSIRDNIALANPMSDMDKIEQVSKLAGCDSFIRALPKAYDTVVGERGSMLSTGQRQRIAIARALINDPKILIFDEATSALDYEAEMQVQENMQEICKGRTVIIIAHRLSTLRIADRILFLKDGSIVEDGKPKELIKNKQGEFYKLSQKQII